MILDWILALSPILLIIILMVRFGWGAAKAGFAGWMFALGLAVVRFGAGTAILAFGHLKALLLSFDVLLIVWGAFLLYRVIDEAGAISIIGQALPQLTSDRGMQALLIGWTFASFLQGVGGFGVPVAVTAPLLVGLGFSPLTAVVVPSVGHAWAVTFGSLASSFQALIAASGWSGEDLTVPAASLLGLAAIGCGFMVVHAADGWQAMRRLLLPVLVIGTFMGTTQYVLATHGLWNVASFAGGIVGLIVGVGLANRYRGDLVASTRPAVDRRKLLLSLSGYLVLIGITLLVQLSPYGKQSLSVGKISLHLPAMETRRGYLTPADDVQLTPLLRHAGALLGYAALIAFLIYQRAGLYRPDAKGRIVRSTLRRLLPSTVGIVSMVCMAVVMTQSGMTDVLAMGLAQSVGSTFPFTSVWIGALGAFITGSNTNSNLVFAMLQRRTAELLAQNVPVVLAAQTAGGAIGSVAAPTKIIVGASTSGAVGKEGVVLRVMLPYVGLLILIIALIAWVQGV